jgi:hypothetical protein
MSKIDNKSIDIFATSGVQDLSNESAAALTGGNSGTVKDVTLKGKDKNGKTVTFASNDAVANLGKFDNKANFVAVNNNKTWRFYDLPNFDPSGGFEDVGPNTGRRLTSMKGKVSSFKAL